MPVSPSPPTDPAAGPPAAGSGAPPEPLSARNPRVTRLTRLARQARARSEEGAFVIDGPTLLAEAVQAGVRITDVYLDPGALDRPEVDWAVGRARAGGAASWVVTGGLKGHVEVTTPNGVAAVADIPSPAEEVATGPAPLHLVLVGVSDPGNVGTLLRTAEAVGAASVLLADGSVDPWAPKVVRASAGSVLRVPVRSGAAADLLRALGAAGVARVATAGDRGRAPAEIDLAGPVALVLGSEAHGLPADLDALVDEWASLPMEGEVESLNVAVAGSVLAFEVVRQRAAGPVR